MSAKGDSGSLIGELRRRGRRRVIIGILAVALTVPLALQVWGSIASVTAGWGPICRVATTDRVVALSFDDGPSQEFTPRMLDLLVENEASATFFVVGDRVSSDPALVQREIDAGMELGNHTATHPNLLRLDESQVQGEVTGGQDALDRALAHAPAVSLFRAPYGFITSQSVADVRDLGYEPAHWSIAVDHYVGGLGLSPTEAARSMVADMEPGDIILAHDAPILARNGAGDREAATQATEILVGLLHEQGFQMVSISELLNHGAPVAARPKPWLWETGYSCP